MTAWPDDVLALIPAYRPDAALVEIARNLVGRGCPLVIVVDDGGGPAFAAVFEALRRLERVAVVTHPVNLGKGAALKTGLAHALNVRPDLRGVLTLDADGQHRPDDAQGVARRFVETPHALVLGVRQFQSDMPWRSKLGNTLTRHLFRMLVGQRLSDTQTGLRAIPAALIPVLLAVPSDRYEFELDMLLQCGPVNVPILEHPIAAVYLDGNKSSHFDPIFDSLRIYFALFRFVLSAMFTGLVDLGVFWLVLLPTDSVVGAMAAGRATGALVNFGINRRFVFLHRPRPLFTLAKYLALVVTFGLISYALVRFLSDQVQMPVIVAKVIAEIILFIFSFLAQRQVVFARDRR